MKTFIDLALTENICGSSDILTDLSEDVVTVPAEGEAHSIISGDVRPSHNRADSGTFQVCTGPVSRGTHTDTECFSVSMRKCIN